MKVLRDKDIKAYLDSKLSRDSILNEFQPVLVNGLKSCLKDTDKIIPPRIVQPSNKPNVDTTHLFMPCISPTSVGIKLISGGPSNNAKGLGFQGTILLLDEDTGATKAILNAATVTAFRTALASTTGLTKVIRVDKDILPELTVYGSGAQAYWHVKLALILYGAKITSVNIINRTLPNAEKLGRAIGSEFPGVRINTFSYQDKNSSAAIHVQNSSIIFGCLPSTEATIQAAHLNADPAHPKFVSLIGSYKPHMVELDVEFIKSELKGQTKILVDSKEHTLHEAGELIQAGIGEDGLVDLAELYSNDWDPVTYTTNTNLTVQKLVGLAIMDVAVGTYIADHIDNAIDVDDF